MTTQLVICYYITLLLFVTSSVTNARDYFQWSQWGECEFRNCGLSEARKRTRLCQTGEGCGIAAQLRPCSNLYCHIYNTTTTITQPCNGTCGEVGFKEEKLGCADERFQVHEQCKVLTLKCEGECDTTAAAGTATAVATESAETTDAETPRTKETTEIRTTSSSISSTIDERTQTSSTTTFKPKSFSPEFTSTTRHSVNTNVTSAGPVADERSKLMWILIGSVVGGSMLIGGICSCVVYSRTRKSPQSTAEESTSQNQFSSNETGVSPSYETIQQHQGDGYNRYRTLTSTSSHYDTLDRNLHPSAATSMESLSGIPGTPRNPRNMTNPGIPQPLRDTDSEGNYGKLRSVYSPAIPQGEQTRFNFQPGETLYAFAASKQSYEEINMGYSHLTPPPEVKRYDQLTLAKTFLNPYVGDTRTAPPNQQSLYDIPSHGGDKEEIIPSQDHYYSTALVRELRHHNDDVYDTPPPRGGREHYANARSPKDIYSRLFDASNAQSSEANEISRLGKGNGKNV